MSIIDREDLPRRFLREQQESLNELSHLPDPHEAYKELVRELEHAARPGERQLLTRSAA